MTLLSHDIYAAFVTVHQGIFVPSEPCILVSSAHISMYETPIDFIFIFRHTYFAWYILEKHNCHLHVGNYIFDK